MTVAASARHVSCRQGRDMSTMDADTSRNETDHPAQDVSVIIAPVAGAFRGELDAPGPYCDF